MKHKSKSFRVTIRVIEPLVIGKDLRHGATQFGSQSFVTQAKGISSAITGWVARKKRTKEARRVGGTKERERERESTARKRLEHHFPVGAAAAAGS